MATVFGESLSRADIAWLHAEAPTNHFVVTSLAILDRAPDVARLKAMLQHRLPQEPRLRQVVTETGLPFATATWRAARDFDLDAHIHRLALPQPAGTAELAALIGDLVGQPLDFERPLWSLHAIETAQGGALVGRFHHSLGDGQAMVRLLLTLTDPTADGWKHRPRVRARGEDRSGGRRSLVGKLVDSVSSPVQLVRTAVDGAGTLARLTLLDPDRATPLRGPLSMVKSVAWTEPISLADIKDVAGASGTTVNDVVVSAIAGGLGAVLRRSGVETAGLRIRAMVPVNLRPADDASMNGNRFSLVFLELPVRVTDAFERLMRVKIEMDRIKQSLEPAAGWLLVQGLGFLPAAMEHVASSFYASKASLVLTNVAGLQHTLFIAGSRIRQMTFWEPESGGLGLGVSIYSYAGKVTVGAVSDRHLLPRPEVLTEEVAKAFGDLVRSVADGR